MQKILFFNWSWASVLLAVGLLASACKKEAAPVEPMDPEFDFKLRVVNDQGIERSTFKQGENFWLSLVITNKINEARRIDAGMTGLFSLFRVVQQEGAIDKGKPWEPAICIGTAGYRLEPKTSLEIKMPWRSDTTYYNFCMKQINQPFLTKGNYETQLTDAIEVTLLESRRLTKKLNLKARFSIQ